MNGENAMDTGSCGNIIHPAVIPPGGQFYVQNGSPLFEKRLAELQQQIDDLTARINSMAAECQP